MPGSQSMMQRPGLDIVCRGGGCLAECGKEKERSAEDKRRRACPPLNAGKSDPSSNEQESFLRVSIVCEGVSD